MGDERQIPALEEARDALIEVGDTETAAEAEAFLSRAAWYRGRGDDARRHLERAQELVADAGPTVAKARVLCLSARLHMLSSEEEEAIRIGTEALALAEKLDLDELRIHALTSVGTARAWLDHTGGVELDLALEIAKATNSPLAVTVLNNLGVIATQTGDVVRSEEFNLETLRTAERMGDGENIRFARANLLYSSMFRGRWDETVENADRFIAECETSPHNMEQAAREMRAVIRLARGDIEGALDDSDHALALARELKNPTRVLPALLGRARGLALIGRDDEARALVFEGIAIARETPTIAQIFGIFAGKARRLGVTSEVVEILRLASDGPWKDAALAEAEGDGVRAADLYHSMGAPALEADARFGAADAFLEDGRTAEGLAELEKALPFYRSVGATFFIERGEALLARSSERLGVVEREAVGHARQEVDGLVDVVAALDQVGEDPPHDVVRAAMLALHLRPEVHALEHERPQREHCLPHVRALDDVACVRGCVDEVPHEPVDALRARRPEQLDLRLAADRPRSRRPKRMASSMSWLMYATRSTMRTIFPPASPAPGRPCA